MEAAMNSTEKAEMQEEEIEIIEGNEPVEEEGQQEEEETVQKQQYVKTNKSA